MIGKTKTGRGFRGTLAYCLDESKKPEILDKNCLSHNDVKGLTKEMVNISSDNRNVNKPVWHSSISFPAQDNITNDKMVEIANRLMEKAGFNRENNQWVIIKHNNTKNTHCHIVGNRVGFNGKTISDYYFKSQTVKWAKELEEEFKLVKVQELAKQRRLEKNLNNTFDPEKESLKKTIDQLLQQHKVNTFQKLGDSLRKQGIEMQVVCHSKTGRAYGVTFKMGDKVYKGSDLGKKFAFGALSDKLLLLPSQIPTIKLAKAAVKILAKGLELGMSI
jgi:hypothetical protein